MHDIIQPIRKTLWRRRQSRMVLLSILIVLAVADSVALQTRSATTATPDIVARVNGETVTVGELHRVQADLLELRRLQGQSGDKNPKSEDLDSLVLQKLIQRHLMLQEAGRRKLRVIDDDLDEAINDLRRRFADLKSFGAWMGERGLDDASLIEAIRGDLLVGRVNGALLETGMQVSEEQVVAYYEAHKDDLIIGEEVRLGIIAVNSIEAGKAILTALSEGVNFRRLARRYSLGQRAAEGGDTGWVDLRTLPPPLRQTASRLKAGEAYGPVEKNVDEFLIVALADRRPVHAKSLDEARPEVERQLKIANQQ